MLKNRRRRNMKCVLVLFGESFRLGGQGSRNTGSDESFAGQMDAVDSHLAFVEHLKARLAITSEIVINTYSTRFDEQLSKRYSENISGARVRFNFNPERIGLQNIFNQSCDLVSSGIDDADFIQFMRVDLILKRPFLDIFYPETERICWPSVCFAGWHNFAGSPRVSDTMLYVPRRHFGLVKNKEILFAHEGWHHLKGRIGSGNQRLMLGTLHDSDSAKDWNPIYWMSGRHRNENWSSLDFKIDENLTVTRMREGRWTLFDQLN